MFYKIYVGDIAFTSDLILMIYLNLLIQLIVHHIYIIVTYLIIYINFAIFDTNLID